MLINMSVKLFEYKKIVILNLDAMVFLLISVPVQANNVAVSAIELKDQKNSKTIQIEFDLSWDNSWKNSRFWRNWVLQ